MMPITQSNLIHSSAKQNLLNKVKYLTNKKMLTMSESTFICDQTFPQVKYQS